MPHPPLFLRARARPGGRAVTASRQELGRRGEAFAGRHLHSLGYAILESNYRTRRGEIDLVAEKDGHIVFVEVRTRIGNNVGSPEESVTAKKRAHLVAVAQEYLQAHGAEGRDWRIDVVAVEMRPRGGLERVDVLENAVEL